MNRLHTEEEMWLWRNCPHGWLEELATAAVLVLVCVLIWLFERSGLT